jgi:protein-tyrosine phosphatase
VIGVLRRALDAGVTRVHALCAVFNARRSTEANLAGLECGRILVVCYGNIYRSPFVERLLQKGLASTFSVRSAGFHPVGDRPAPAGHIEKCRQYGVSLDDHRSSVITSEAVAWADVIVLMDRHNWAALTRHGAKPQQLVWLGALAAGPVEIPDPYHMTDAAAEAVVARMHAACGELLKTLWKIA